MDTRKSRGQSVVEFAMTLPVFLLLVVGIFDLGLGVASYSLLTNVAREGARTGIIPATSDADILAAVNSQTLFLGNIPSGSITITPSTQADRRSGGNITVSVDYQYHPVTPLLSNVVGSTITMSASSTMLIE